MKLEVSKTDLITGVYVFAVFMPGYFSNPIFKLLENIMLLVGFFFVVQRGGRLSKFAVYAALYHIYLIVISFVNDTDAADIHLIISYCKIVVFLFFLDIVLRENRYGTIKILMGFLAVFVGMDALSIVFFPKGLYQTYLHWNIWTVSAEAQWIYGSKNNRIYWYIMLVLVCWYRYKMTRKGKWAVLLTALASVVIMALTKSSTAVIAAVIMAAGIVLEAGRGEEMKAAIHPYVILAGYVVCAVMIIMGKGTVFEPFITGILKKDMTFSTRIFIWKRLLTIIPRHLWFGAGVLSNRAAVKLLGKLTYVSAHNQILNTLWQGGICLSVLTAACFLHIADNIRKNGSRSHIFVVSAALSALLIDMILESILSVKATWICLLLINNSYLIINGSEYIDEEFCHEEQNDC